MSTFIVLFSNYREFTIICKDLYLTHVIYVAWYEETDLAASHEILGILQEKKKIFKSLSR